MYKILFAFLTLQIIVTISGSSISGSSIGSVRVDVDNEAEIIEAAKPLPGVINMHEKTIPLIRLQLPSGYTTGLKNLHEKLQIPQTLPGTDNMKEKVMPIAALLKSYEDDHAYHKSN